MRNKLLGFVVALAAMLGCVGSAQAQNWSWTGVAPASGSSYYLLAKYGDNSPHFLNEQTGFDEEPKVLWTVGGNFPGDVNGGSSFTLTSSNDKTFSIYDGGLQGITRVAKVSTSETRTGDDICLAAHYSEDKQAWNFCRYKKIHFKGIFDRDGEISERNIAVSEDGNISVASNPTATWVFMKQNEYEAYVAYIDACNNLKPIVENANNKILPIYQDIATALADGTNIDNAAENTQRLVDLYNQYQALETFTNPLVPQDAADPSVILGDDGFYYLYSSEHYEGEGIPLWRSADMVSWEKMTNIFPKSDRPTQVGYTFLWAPEIAKIDGKYVLYFANAAWGNEKNTQICVATSDKPYGPFEYKGVLFSATGANGTINASVENCIDPSLFTDDDGKKYMVWGSWHGIWYWELAADGLSVVGNKKAMSSSTSGDWTKIEAPMIVKHNGYYYLIASKGTTAGTQNPSDITYKLVMARSESLGGTFVDVEGENVFRRNSSTMFGLLEGTDFVLGPGHCSQIVTDKNGTDWIFYHGYAKKDGKWDMATGRVPFVSPVLWDEWYEGWPGILPIPDQSSIVKPAVDEPCYIRQGLATGEYYTICLPYASASKEGARFFSVEGVQKISGKITGVYLSEVGENEQLVAGTPYVFLATAETMKVTYSGMPYTGTTGTSYGMVGNLAPQKMKVEEGCYFMYTKNTIAKTTDKVKSSIGENRAYFDLDGVKEYDPENDPAVSTGAKKVIMFGLAGTANSINEIVVGTEDGVMYNIMGQRVVAGTKGLVIMNGKKMFVK